MICSEPNFKKPPIPVEETFDKEEYIRSLENLLIFMCGSYDKIDNSLVELAEKEHNHTWFKVPRIQGLYHIINISKIGKLEFEEPNYGFKEVLEIINSRRNKNE
ncbi:hypothetical protein MCG45_16395 [Clostridium perfringens]|uniref:hypothetical protein n=1 Tax=Clostridium perfringens TaxID=1502 RepID=UPI001F054505|nr:hypothetical protein [Clostridium perfringens]MCH1964411.1 hypothetical protein [Clostridium perfringens]